MNTAATQPPPITQQLLAIARDIKISHTVFALPFALLAMVLASSSSDRSMSWAQPVLIVLCMVTARTFAMTFNRWADASIDAANPRTEGRAIPAGRVGRGTMLGFVVLCGVAFVLTATGFWLVDQNPWPAYLSLPVLGVLAGYSLAKRFTWLCHLFLGFALAISPVAAAIAIEPGYLGQPVVWLLAGMVLCWVAGFDILYALQDVQADREHGLYSIPSRLGVGRALWISRLLHVLSAAALIVAGWASDQLSQLFMIATGLTVALLVLEHALVWGGKTKQLNMAFFTVNGVISLLLGAAGIIDVVTA